MTKIGIKIQLAMDKMVKQGSYRALPDPKRKGTYKIEVLVGPDQWTLFEDDLDLEDAAELLHQFGVVHRKK